MIFIIFSGYVYIHCQSQQFHTTLCRTYRTLCILVRQPITDVKAEWNVAADVREVISLTRSHIPIITIEQRLSGKSHHGL